jgi:hydroxymethylpyrimidine pyrophosphatase-like HAD family hydrolase
MGTLAQDECIPPPLQHALEQLHLAGYVLFLVTGRRTNSIQLGALQTCFAGIVWENGAVLSDRTSNELYLPFGHLDPRLVDALEAARVPLEHGVAIRATWVPHEETVWRILRETQSEAAIVHNKGALMLLPPGAAKGSGLERLLELCGFSRHNRGGEGLHH